MKPNIKINIKTLHVTFPSHQLPIGLIAGMALKGFAEGMSNTAANTETPEIGEKWPGLDAIYAGTALSSDETTLVHLILWEDDPKRSMEYDDAVKHAESVNPAMQSHLPTRHQSITLFERLQDQFDQERYHWTLTKTKSGKAAFSQNFDDGNQYYDDLSAECRVRAVSEIPL